MSNSGKQSPLGVNVLSSVLQNIGLNINPIMTDYVGTSTTNSSYTLGSIVDITCLRSLTYAINDSYVRGYVNIPTYNNLISIGAGVIPGMGNSPPTTFDWTDYPNWATNYTYTNPVTQWGYVRLFALQGYNEFNYNSGLSNDAGAYKDFLSGFMSTFSFIEYSNSAILAVHNSKEFLDGTFSNMDDLITADITGVSLATTIFGQDLIASGKVINLKSIATFGLPSNLLKTLQQNNAITRSLSIALIASGIESTELSTILNNIANTTTEQERKLYAAYSIILGQDLKDILITLNCKTVGLVSLCDLLNPIKLFPNSYLTLTVPVYNTVGGPANSKIYYHIYTEGSLNIQLSSPTMIQFGSYLYSILPDDIRIACGAFSTSMQQIKNISNVPVEKFAQVVNSIETTKGLTVNSTSVPTDTTLAQQATNLIALGNGPYNTYTMSNFLGCMSGLPYLGINVRQNIQELQTQKLVDIYNQLYLAVSWQPATFNVTTEQQAVETSPGVYDWQYRITGTTFVNRGGGYSRDGAPPPGGDYTFSDGTIASPGGVVLSTNPDTNPANAPTTYGRMVNLVVSGTPGAWVTYGSGGASPSNPGIQYRLPAPPTAYNSYPYTGGTNSTYGTIGWPGMNTVVQSLIDDANTEILAIKNSQPAKAQDLITNWELTGTLLSTEQRAIFTGMTIRVPNSSPDNEREPTLAVFPTTQYSFVDSIPQYAMFTEPHMYSQTLEAISDYATVGGNSLAAMLREARNQKRLTDAGIVLDNNILDKLTPKEQAQLIGNGTLGGSTPATLSTPIGTPDPYGYYDPATNQYYNTNPEYKGNGAPVDTGQADEPGSFAGSPYSDLISPNMSVIFASRDLLPSTYPVREAIEQVILCNCDCWDNI